MEFNTIEKIEYVFCNYDFGSDDCNYKKRYIINKNGKFIILYYSKNEKKPCFKNVYFVSQSAIKKLFFELRFLIHHANINLMPHDDCMAELIIFYRFKNYELARRGLAFGIYNKKHGILKAIFIEKIIAEFILNYGDGKYFYNADFIK